MKKESDDSMESESLSSKSAGTTPEKNNKLDNVFRMGSLPGIKQDGWSQSQINKDRKPTVSKLSEPSYNSYGSSSANQTPRMNEQNSRVPPVPHFGGYQQSQLQDRLNINVSDVPRNESNGSGTYSSSAKGTTTRRSASRSGYDEFDSNQGMSDKGKSISDHSNRQMKK